MSGRGQIRFHDKNDPMKQLLLTKRIAAKGTKMHTWQKGPGIMGMVEPGTTWYRCVVCDFLDWAVFPRTPEPHPVTACPQ